MACRAACTLAFAFGWPLRSLTNTSQSTRSPCTHHNAGLSAPLGSQQPERLIYDSQGTLSSRQPPTHPASWSGSQSQHPLPTWPFSLRSPRLRARQTCRQGRCGPAPPPAAVPGAGGSRPASALMDSYSIVFCPSSTCGQGGKHGESWVKVRRWQGSWDAAGCQAKRPRQPPAVRRALPVAAPRTRRLPGRQGSATASMPGGGGRWCAAHSAGAGVSSSRGPAGAAQQRRGIRQAPCCRLQRPCQHPQHTCPATQQPGSTHKHTQRRVTSTHLVAGLQAVTHIRLDCLITVCLQQCHAGTQVREIRANQAAPLS